MDLASIELSDINFPDIKMPDINLPDIDLAATESQQEFLILFLVAIILSKTPLRAPFKWAETFFHELSHGLMAVLTLGRFSKMELRVNGSGTAWTSGGSRILILLAGYLGAISWGALIYLAGKAQNQSGSADLIYVLISTLLASCILWARDFKTQGIMLIMATTFGLASVFTQHYQLSLAVEFIGIYILRSAITAPLNLIDGKSEGDGAELAQITVIFPEAFWITLWLAYGLFVSYWLWQGAPNYLQDTQSFWSHWF